LFYRFQSGTRLVYVTGERDNTRVEEDLLSVRSMSQWCVFNAESIVEPFVDHAVAVPAALSRALGTLTDGVRPDPGRLERCRSAVDAELDRRLHKAATLRASGKRAASDRLLADIDQQYGGLAAPRSLKTTVP
jgi:hypothetical protein